MKGEIKGQDEVPFPNIDEERMAAVACTMAVWSQSVSLQTVGSTSGNRMPIVPNACSDSKPHHITVIQ